MKAAQTQYGCIFTRNLRFAYKLVRTSLYYHFHQKSNFNDVSSTHIAFLEHFRERLFREFRFSAVERTLVQPNLPKACVHNRLLLTSSLLRSMNTGKSKWLRTSTISKFSTLFSKRKSREFLFSELLLKLTSQTPKTQSAVTLNYFPSEFKRCSLV